MMTSCLCEACDGIDEGKSLQEVGEFKAAYQTQAIHNSPARKALRIIEVFVGFEGRHIPRMRCTLTVGQLVEFIAQDVVSN